VKKFWGKGGEYELKIFRKKKGKTQREECVAWENSRLRRHEKTKQEKKNTPQKKPRIGGEPLLEKKREIPSYSKGHERVSGETPQPLVEES